MKIINKEEIVNKFKSIITKIDNNCCFFISRTLNKNIVNYSFIENEEVLSINPYWIMFEKNENNPPKEDLTFLEKNTAYGIKYSNQNKHSCDIGLVGYSNIKLKVNRINDQVNTLININESENNLVKVIGIHIHQNLYNIINPVEGLSIYYLDNICKNNEIDEKKIKVKYIKR